MEARTVDYSRTTITELMIPSYANFSGAVHGGLLLSLMDKVAYVCASKHSGAYFSQHSVLYRDKECRKVGWPMKSPNPHASDMGAAKQLVEVSRKLVGLK